MSLQSNRPVTVPPVLTSAQLAYVACADTELDLFIDLKSKFDNLALLFPLSGNNRFGFSQAQMVGGLGADATEFTNVAKFLLSAIASIMPSFPGDTWAARPEIRGFFALLGVTLPNGF